MHINYALQTNGLALNDEWAEFLAANQVLVGISLDGTKELHDNTRLDAKGKGTWNRVTAALHVLQKHDVEVNLLCVVNRAVARSPQKVYASLKNWASGICSSLPAWIPLRASVVRSPGH